MNIWRYVDVYYRSVDFEKSHVDTGVNHVDVYYRSADFVKRHVDVLQETPEGVSAYQATEVDALTQKSCFDDKGVSWWSLEYFNKDISSTNDS